MTHLSSVTRPCVDIPCCIKLDAVGDSSVDVCEYSAICERHRLRIDVERISSKYSAGQYVPPSTVAVFAPYMVAGFV